MLIYIELLFLKCYTINSEKIEVEIMKKLIPAFILSFVIAFMLYIVEPITMFVSNRNDFHFNFVNIIKPVLLVFFITFILLSLIYTVIYLINKKLSKNFNFYNIILIISFILFILLYIQGNYMTNNLPALDGSSFSWSIYFKENVITISILILLIVGYIICIKKYGFEKVINASKYITLAIFAMLFTGLLPSLLSKDLYKNDTVLFVKNENINNISTNKNFLIFVLDAVDSRTFARELEKSEYKDVLKDFTYYPDTLSMYVFTRESIPYMLSGIPNLNETDFTTYYNNAMDNSPFIKRLKEEDYQINLYETDLIWNTEESSVVQNIEDFNKSLPSTCYLKNQTKYVLFKYLPFFLKSYSKAESFNLNYCKTDSIPGSFTFSDRDLYDIVNNNNLEKVENNYFSFIHIEGAHVPLNLDENLNKIGSGTYSQKINASIKVFNSYIERLRTSGEYDNSVIILMADHGFVEEGEGTRANPILYIKGLNEHHDMKVSDKAISYSDLMDAYNDLLDGKKSSELFPSITSTRERKYIWYRYLYENNKIEIATNGKAWEYQKEYKTGKEYNR